MDNFQPNIDTSQVLELYKKLDHRIAVIEDYLGISPKEAESKSDQNNDDDETAEQSSSLEFQIGENWFAKVGIVVLAIGIAFLLTLPFENLPAYIPSVFGFAITGGILWLSNKWQKNFELVSKYLLGAGLLLLYFSTLRLHFFDSQPAVENKILILTLLLIVVMLNTFIGLKRNSISLVGISLFLGYITAIIGENPYFIFFLVLALSVTASYLKLRMNWQSIGIIGIVFTYFTHFLWAIGNPIMGNKIAIIAGLEFNLIFLLFYVLAFAVGNYFREKDTPETPAVIISTLLNIGGFFMLFLFMTLLAFKESAGIYHLVCSLILLIISFLFWTKHNSIYSTFFFAITGYTALSVAIIHQFEVPNLFIVLGWQSIVVIVTAIWFRSRIIIVANFILYLIILSTFLVMAGEVGIISMSFGIIALISARILNWKKDRLELKTELMRNAYLICALFIIPYSLYSSVPEGYFIISLVMVTIVYYVLSIMLKNRKYRWMGHATLLLTVFYIIIMSTGELDPVYRIFSFLIVGIVLIVVSLLYTKYRSRLITEAGNEDRNMSDDKTDS